MAGEASKLFIGVYTHHHGEDTAVYATRQQAELGLLSSVMQADMLLQQLTLAQIGKLMELYKDGKYAEAIAHYNASSLYEKLSVSEDRAETIDWMRPFTGEELNAIMAECNPEEPDGEEDGDEDRADDV